MSKSDPDDIAPGVWDATELIWSLSETWPQWARILWALPTLLVFAFAAVFQLGLFLVFLVAMAILD